MKQKGSSDVKGSLWNHLDKKVILWHREAPLFLRVHVCKIDVEIQKLCFFYIVKKGKMNIIICVNQKQDI